MYIQSRVHRAHLAAVTEQHSSSCYSNLYFASIDWLECYFEEGLADLVFQNFIILFLVINRFSFHLVSIKFKGRFGSSRM